MLGFCGIKVKVRFLCKKEPNVISSVLKLALLEHFHSQPLSVLCCKKKEALRNLTQLSHEDLERIRQLPSFTRYTGHWSKFTILCRQS